MDGYCEPDEVYVIRVFRDSEGWNIDGMSLDGRYTEACCVFDTEAIARASIPQFIEEFGIRPDVLIEEPSAVMAEKIRAKFRKKESTT